MAATTESAALMFVLRRHVHACTCRVWEGRCRPAVGRYCSIGAPLYDAFARARRREVFGG